MSGGCTECGNKGDCDHRKGGMFAAIDEALIQLYPTRRWGEWDEARAFRAGVTPAAAAALADDISRRLQTLTLYRPGADDEYCDWLYVLCFGRQPSILEVREGAVSPTAAWAETAGEPLEELHLRVALSTLAPFAAVQQVTMRMESAGDEAVITEAPRTGVFDPILLPRFQKLVAALAEADLRHLDFGDLTLSPEGFDAASYRDRYDADPMLANYIFYPQPCASVTTTVVPLVGGVGESP